MPFLFLHPSSKRSLRTRTRKDSISADTDVVCPPSRSSIFARRKTRPPSLQIIPELSENEADIDVSSIHFPVTGRQTQSFPQPPESKTSRVTLPAYTFSIDEATRSPALSLSSSTSGGASSEDALTIPGIPDDEGEHDVLPSPRVCPQHISIRPRCIAGARSLICQESEDTHNNLEEEVKGMPPVTEKQPESSVDAKAATEGVEDAEKNFYMREIEDFVSLSPVIISTTPPARRDSLTLTAEALPTIIDDPEPKPRDCSRHAPADIHPVSSFPAPTLSLVQTCARQDSNPFPRAAVRSDVEDCIFPEEPDIPEIPLSGAHGEATLPRSSTDSDVLRVSIHSASSCTSSDSSDAPMSPLSFLKSPSPDYELESTQRLGIRWSNSSSDSTAVQPPRAHALLSPLRSVFGSRAHRGLLPPKNVPPQMPPHLSKDKHHLPAMQSPLSTLGKHIRRQRSRLSTSSAETSSSERDSHDGSLKGPPRGLKRKPIPVSTFLRSS